MLLSPWRGLGENWWYNSGGCGFGTHCRNPVSSVSGYNNWKMICVWRQIKGIMQLSGYRLGWTFGSAPEVQTGDDDAGQEAAGRRESLRSPQLMIIAAVLPDRGVHP